MVWAESSEDDSDDQKPHSTLQKELGGSTPAIAENASLPSQAKRKKLFGFLLMFVIILAIILALSLTLTKEEEEEEYAPTTVKYSTGVTHIAHYSIEALVTSRLARTSVTIGVTNGMDCSSIRSILFQKPLGARVVSLKTISDECQTNGKVQELGEARETFLESATEGMPTAYVEGQDSTTHNLQVAVPPFKSTVVEIVLEELLEQRLDKVDFQIPFMPDEEIDQVMFDFRIDDMALDWEKAQDQLSNSTNGTGASLGVFELDLGPSFQRVTNDTSPEYHLHLTDARRHAGLPTIIHGSFIPNEIPDKGLFFVDVDDNCFEYFIRPSSLDPMARDIIFLLDTSASMHESFGRGTFTKFDHAKLALKDFLGTMSPQDTLRIQTFGETGTTDLFGSVKGTPEAIADASKFIDDIDNSGSYSTNLHAAILEALLRARTDSGDDSGDTVRILMLISDGWASAGETDRPKIAEDVFKLNDDGKVKIFSLGFQDSSDSELLDAIAIMNGGVTETIRYGYVELSEQMLNFFAGEFGNVLLSDVKVAFQGGDAFKAYGNSQTTFPLLADGYEVVVRGLYESLDEATLDKFKVETSASTTNGPDTWSASPIQATNSLCFQSYAHARITQLMRYHDAAEFVGSDVLEDAVGLAESCKTELPECIKEEALALALKANVVVKDLTAMVTIDKDKCMTFDKEAEICRDGSIPDEYLPDEEENGHYDDTGEYNYADEYDGGYKYGVEGSEGFMVSINLVLASIACVLLPWILLLQ